jgi:diguanylate cyclase (GGDEF)-like protein/PAS domain S-box-containing protein
LAGHSRWFDLLLDRWRARVGRLALASSSLLVKTQSRKEIESAAAAAQVKAALQERDRQIQEQNERLDTALNNMRQGLLLFDSESRLILCNQRYLQMYGLAREAAKPGCSLRDLLIARKAAGTFAGDPDQYITTFVDHGRVETKTVTLPDQRIISITNAPAPSGGWVSTHDDITDQRQREESFRLLFETNPVPMFVYDRETLAFLAVNGAAIAHYGYTGEQFRRMTLLDIRPAEDRELFIQLAPTTAGKYDAEHTWRHKKADGTTFDAAIYSRALHYEGRPAGLTAVIDITERKRAEDETRRMQNFLNMIVENVPATIFVKDAGSRQYVLINRAGEQYFGIPRESMIGKTSYEVFPKLTADKIAKLDQKLVESKAELFLDEHGMDTPGNGTRTIVTKRLVVPDDHGNPRYLLGVIQDITDRKRLEEAERATKKTLAAVIDASPVAIICLTPDRRVAVWSRSAEQIFGYSAEEALGQPFKLVPSGYEEEFDKLFRRALSGETLRDIQLRLQKNDGALVDIGFAGAAMHDRDGSITGVAYALEDVTERKKIQERLKYLAHYDELTGLLNRTTLQTDIEHLLETGGRGGEPPFSIAMFDLDGFKDVNDTLGHYVGDQLLKEIASRVNAIGTARARVYRLGGDEFVVVAADCGDPLVVSDVVESMLRRIAEPVQIDNQVLYVRASAGVAIAPSDGATAEELLASVDLALYDAKTSNRGKYRFFVPVLRARAQARRTLESELRRAFANQEFELYYQPQIRLADNGVVGAEALLRWRHPERGLLAPGAFIDGLTESAVARDVGRWVLHTACEQAAAWRRSERLLRVAVNLFPIQFHDGALVRDVEEALCRSGLPAEALELEITENIALGHDDALLEPLRQLRARGVNLAFDDFGTGYASLSYLRRYPLSRIKIDRSFVGKTTEGAEDAAIVSSLITMAHNLGLGVVAEGVETPAQALFLTAEDCDEAQGFLFAKPMPSSQFEEFLTPKTNPRGGRKSEGVGRLSGTLF